MLITHLKESPQDLPLVLQLIESEFGYTAPHRFQEDFYPLMKPENHHQCYFVKDHKQNIVAHIGCLTRLLHGHKIAMYGGIAVAKEYQGQGHFKTLFRHVLQINHHVAFHCLWSEKLELYQKFDFFPCIQLFEYAHDTNDITIKSLNIKRSTFSQLSESQRQTCQNLYHQSSEWRIQRSDWKDYMMMNSVQFILFFNEFAEMENYCCLGKGQDLKGIIHEYGKIDQYWLNIFRLFGTVWSPIKLSEEKSHTQLSKELFATVLKIGNIDLFKKFMFEFAQIKVLDIDDGIVEFNYKDEFFTQLTPDFLCGVFGPGKFKELSPTADINFSGLDSI